METSVTNGAYVEDDIANEEQKHPSPYDPGQKEQPTPYDPGQGDQYDTCDMLSMVGGYGCFQRILNIMLMLLAVPASMQIVIMCFVGDKSDWRCVEGSDVCRYNGTFTSTDARRCSMPRDAWTYTATKDYSVVTEFDAVCDREWLVSFSTTLFFVAWMVGAIVMGWLSDNFGRRRTIFVCQTVVIGATFVSAFVTNFYLFLACRVVVGFFCPGTFPQMFILISEIVTDKYRAFAGVSIFIAAAVGAAVLCLKAYLIPHWRSLTIVCSAPYSILLLCYFFVPESVAFHRVKGKVDKAMKTLHRITEWNGTSIPQGVVLSMPTTFGRATKPRHTSPLDLFRSRKLALLTLVQCYTWFAGGVAYVGLFLAAEDLDGGLYRDFIMMTIGEIVGNVIIVFLMERVGRKSCTVASMFIGSLICIALGFTPSSGFALVRLLFGILGKATLTASFNAMHTWSVELFPTTMRGEAMGVLQVAVRIGTGSAPWVANELKKLHRSAPFVTIGAVSLVAFFVMFYLPETKGNRVSDTGEEMDLGEKTVKRGKEQSRDISIAVISNTYNV